METALFIYLAALAGNLSSSFEVLIGVSIFSIIICCFWYLIAHDVHSWECEEGEKKVEAQQRRSKPAMKFFKLSGASFLVFFILWSITPSERTMYLMAGAYIGQQALTSEVSKDLQDIVALQVKKYKNELPVS